MNDANHTSRIPHSGQIVICHRVSRLRRTAGLALTPGGDHGQSAVRNAALLGRC
jgi:hypothetical protein